MMARLDVTATETIDRPLADVWALSCDIERYPEWVPATLEVLRHDGPAQLGVTYAERNRVAGPITAKSHWTVTEFEPMSRQVHRDESIPFLRFMDVVMEFAEAGEGRTRATLSLQGESALGPVGALFLRSMHGSLDRDNQRTLRNLKATAEAG